MKIEYKEKILYVTKTHNALVMRYRFQRLYFGVMIVGCNRYSSIASKQRVDVVMTDSEFNILSFEYDMHENTVFEDKRASVTFLFPLNFFDNLEIGMRFNLMD